MKFYRRYSADTRCVVVCTRCFATLGMAATLAVADELEREHVCGVLVEPEFNDAALRCYAEHRAQEMRRMGRFAEVLLGPKRWSAPLLIVAIVAVVYGVPNLIEILSTGHISPWLLNILFGDLTGCACLAFLLRMPRTSVVLYLALAALDGWLYGTARVSPNTLAWITDAVPTLVVLGRVAQLRVGMRLARE